MLSYKTFGEYLKHPLYLESKQAAQKRSNGFCEFVGTGTNGVCKNKATECCHLKYCKWGEFDPPENLIWICKECDLILNVCSTCKLNRLKAAQIKKGSNVCDSCSLESKGRVQQPSPISPIPQFENHRKDMFRFQSQPKNESAQEILTKNDASNVKVDYTNYKDYLKSSEWSNLRYLVLQKRANGQCEEILQTDLSRCTNKAEHAHHIQYYPWNSSTGYNDTPANLVALCSRCHEQRHTCLVCKVPQSVRSNQIKKQIRVCDSCISKIKSL